MAQAKLLVESVSVTVENNLGDFTQNKSGKKVHSKWRVFSNFSKAFFDISCNLLVLIFTYCTSKFIVSEGIEIPTSHCKAS